ncbi:MAG: hypothetical protein AAGB13_02000 [Cyanobacteria bacterium P01_F01_bin.33]
MGHLTLSHIIALIEPLLPNAFSNINNNFLSRQKLNHEKELKYFDLKTKKMEELYRLINAVDVSKEEAENLTFVDISNPWRNWETVKSLVDLYFPHLRDELLGLLTSFRRLKTAILSIKYSKYDFEKQHEHEANLDRCSYDFTVKKRDFLRNISPLQDFVNERVKENGTIEDTKTKSLLGRTRKLLLSRIELVPPE